jgi:hypothetical protein
LSAAAGSKDKEGTVTPLQQALQQVLREREQRERGGGGAMGRGVRAGGGEGERTFPCHCAQARIAVGRFGLEMSR